LQSRFPEPEDDCVYVKGGVAAFKQLT
jgi:hypothetical protein